MKYVLLIAFFLCAPLTLQARGLYVFGNALVHEDSASPETSVLTWLARLAAAADVPLEGNGQGGDLSEQARSLPPQTGWQIPELAPVLQTSFRRSEIDTFILALPEGEPQIDDLARLLNWSRGQRRQASSWLLETSTDPHRAETLAANLSARANDHPVGIIPAAPLVASLWQTGHPLAGTPAPSPAERAWLAALVVFATLYEAPLPSLALPASFSAELHERQATILQQIRSQSHATPSPPLIEARTVGLPSSSSAPELTLPSNLHAPTSPDPALAMGLTGINDWTVAQPFLDVMKTARPWIGHLPGQWGGMTWQELEAAGVLDPDGWPRYLPDTLDALETLILTDLPEDAGRIAGRYRVTWEGEGRLEISGRARNVVARDGALWFDFAPGGGAVGLRLTRIDPAQPIRSIVVVREDRIPLYELGATFNPDWIALLHGLRIIRFMDWMQTNGSEHVSWEDRPRLSDYTYARNGAPVEVMVELANLLAADPWFTLPHGADDDYARAFATQVRDSLDPRLHVYAEWSNEVWNFIFPQAHWAAEQARLRWNVEGGDSWMQFAGLRAAQIADIWANVFTLHPERLVRVLGVQTGWLGLESPLMEAPLAVAEGRQPPWQSFDAYAVTGYFGHEIGDEALLPQLHDWLQAGTATQHVTELLRAGSLHTLLTEQLPYHARVAREHQLRLVMYEGGTHVAGYGPTVDDDTITRFLIAYNYSTDIAGLYRELLEGWQAVGGEAFNAFVEVTTPTKWGSWGARRHLGDTNPRAAVLDQWNETAGAPWETRSEGTFEPGQWHQGTEGPDQMAGRPGRRDVLLAGAGDDIIQAQIDNLIDGGDGDDTAQLPGSATLWDIQREASLYRAISAQGTITLRHVESLTFEDGTTQRLEP